MSKLLVCQDLTFWYDQKEKPVFSHISLSVSQGETVLLVGPSGCGKSTLAYCLAGLYPEYAGHMEGTVYLGQPEMMPGAISGPEPGEPAGRSFQDARGNSTARFSPSPCNSTACFSPSLCDSAARFSPAPCGSAARFSPALCDSAARFSSAPCGSAAWIPLASYGPAARARRLSILFQNPDNQFCMDRVDHEVMFALENRNYQGDIRARTRSLLAQVGLLDVEMSPIHTLSGGMKQKLALCTALATEAEMLILDEPFANLDPASCSSLASLLEQLNRQGMTLLVVDHRPGWWRPFLSRVVFMEKEGNLDASGMTAREFEKGRDAFISRGLFYDEHWLEGVHPPCCRTSQVQTPAGSSAIVEAEDLTIFHGKKPFMEHLSFQIPRGRVTALVGACGSGKTTLLHALAGIGRYKGRLQVGGRAGLVFQNPRFQFLAQTVEEEILMTLESGNGGKGRVKPEPEAGERGQIRTGTEAGKKGQTTSGAGSIPEPSGLSGKADALLEEFGLLPYKSHSPYALSQGQQRRLALLSMLACDCPLMLLDEPTYAQDEQATRFILDLLKRRVTQGLTVVMATHDLALAAAFASRIFLVDQGKIREVKARELSEGLEIREPRESRESRDFREPQESRDFREPREPGESRESRELQEGQEPPSRITEKGDSAV